MLITGIKGVGQKLLSRLECGPASMLEKAWSGLRDTKFSTIPKASLDNELLIIGYWRWNEVDKVSQLKAVLDVTKQGKLKKGNLEECISNFSLWPY
jgi:hypothetical protein